MNHLCMLILAANLAPPSSGPTMVFDQALLASGIGRPSQLWIDPSGQNDLDSDSLDWEDFSLIRPATVTRVQWWGQVAPSLGFTVEFFNQDPGTVATQPDIFRAGSGSILSEDHPTVTYLGGSGGWYHYEAVLRHPISLDANTRYFVSVVGQTPIPWAEWLWAEGGGVSTGTFSWSRGDTNMFRMMPGNRAMSLLTDVPADYTGDGRVTFADVGAFRALWTAHDPAADLAAPTGVFNLADARGFLTEFAVACP